MYNYVKEVKNTNSHVEGSHVAAHKRLENLPTNFVLLRSEVNK